MGGKEPYAEYTICRIMDSTYGVKIHYICRAEYLIFMKRSDSIVRVRLGVNIRHMPNTLYAELHERFGI